MPRSMMGYVRTQSHRIDFSVRVKGDDVLDQLSFIYLVASRYSGSIRTKKGTYIAGNNMKFSDVEVQFKNHESALDAYAHCRSHLDEDGRVISSYVGALEAVDSRHLEARDMYEKIMGKPHPLYSEPSA